MDEVCEEGVGATELPWLTSVWCCAELDEVTRPVLSFDCESVGPVTPPITPFSLSLSLPVID